MDPLLHTHRLTLTPLGPSDLAWFLALNRQSEVKRHLWDGQSIAKATAAEILEENQALFAKHNYGLWKADLGARTVGYYGLWHFFGESQPQLLYVTDPEHARLGFARDAAEEVLAYAFSTLGYDYVDAAVDTGNQASCAVALALGFREQERRVIDGKPTLFFRLFRAR